MSTDVNIGMGGAGIRKASPEALALMMKNLKQNNSNQKKVWVPNGSNNSNLKKDALKAGSKKGFF